MGLIPLILFLRKTKKEDNNIQICSSPFILLSGPLTDTNESNSISIKDLIFSFISSTGRENSPLALGGSSLNLLNSWISFCVISIIFVLLILMMLSTYNHEPVRLERISQSDPDGHKENLIAKLEFQRKKSRVYAGNIYAQHWRLANAHLTYRDKFRIYRAALNAELNGSIIFIRFELKENDIKLYEHRNPGRNSVTARSSIALIDLIKNYG